MNNRFKVEKSISLEWHDGMPSEGFLLNSFDLVAYRFSTTSFEVRSPNINLGLHLYELDTFDFNDLEEYFKKLLPPNYPVWLISIPYTDFPADFKEKQKIWSSYEKEETISGIWNLQSNMIEMDSKTREICPPLPRESSRVCIE